VKLSKTRSVLGCRSELGVCRVRRTDVNLRMLQCWRMVYLSCVWAAGAVVEVFQNSVSVAGDGAICGRLCPCGTLLPGCTKIVNSGRRCMETIYGPF